MLRPLVQNAEPAVVAGALYDTGRGYPAACFDEPGEIPGWILVLDPARSAAAIEMLDRLEGPEYQRVRVRTRDGRPADAYTWIGPRRDLVPLTAWAAGTEDER
jgi:gamma-glutamylcyclotransferase (GGCT)/AIG2-like uncharacterized protein YtfP